MSEPFIFNNLKSTTGGDHSSRLYTVLDKSTGKTEFVVEYMVLKRYEATDSETAEQDYKTLNGSGIVLSLDQLLSIKKTGGWNYERNTK